MIARLAHMRDGWISERDLGALSMNLARAGLLATLLSMAPFHHGAIAAKLFNLWPVCTTPDAVVPSDVARSNQDWDALRRLDCVAFTESDLKVRVLRCGSVARTPRHEPWIRFYFPEVEFDNALPKLICEIETSIPNLEQTRLFTNFLNILWDNDSGTRPPPAKREAGTATNLARTELLATIFALGPSDLSLEIPPRRIIETKLHDRWPVCTTPDAVVPGEAATSSQDWDALRRLDCVAFTKSDLKVRVHRCGSIAKTPLHEPWARFYYPVEFDNALPKFICEIEASIPHLYQTKLFTSFLNIMWYG